MSIFEGDGWSPAIGHLSEMIYCLIIKFINILYMLFNWFIVIASVTLCTLICPYNRGLYRGNKFLVLITRILFIGFEYWCFIRHNIHYFIKTSESKRLRFMCVCSSHRVWQMFHIKKINFIIDDLSNRL